MKTKINFYDLMTLLYFVIKEKFEKIWVIGPYFVWVTVSEALFWVSVGYFGCMGHYLGVGEWGWIGNCFGWVGVGGKMFLVGGGEWDE